MKFRLGPKKPTATTGKWILFDILAHAVAIVIFGIGALYSFSYKSVAPFIAGLLLAGLLFWLLERAREKRNED
jgi:hypothetical protein